MSSFTSQRLPALLWLASIQYFLAQIVVASAWKTPFSLSVNMISDLGNTACGRFRLLTICSPWHALMNASFIMQGLLMAVGAVLLGRHSGHKLVGRLGFWGLGLAGVGTILVGLFPENTVPAIHVFGAALPFIIGNISLILIGLDGNGQPHWLRFYSAASGLVALVALALLVMGQATPLGAGGLERVVAYPQTIWMMVYGLFILLRRA